MNLLLIEDGKQCTLVDTGAGTKSDDRFRDIYRLEPRSAEEILKPAGLRPAQIDRVINTHLHFDHAGGNTVRDEAGGLHPAFPNAEYVVQRGELETARWDNDRTRASFAPDDFEPLAREEGRLRLVEGDVEISRGILLRVARGHTPFMQLVLLHGTEGTVAFMADLVPTASHVRYPYIMAYDLEPLETLATKRRLLPQAASEGWRLILEHDHEMPLARLEEQQGRLAARAVEAN